MLNTDFSLWAKQINIFTYKYSIMQVKYCLKFVKKSKFVIAKVKEISWNEQKNRLKDTLSLVKFCYVHCEVH